jgi:hypothetical protein
MERFITCENIKRYRKLLHDAKDETERRLIQKLLTEAEHKELVEKTPLPSIASARHVPSQRGAQTPDIPIGIRVIAVCLRALFVGALIAIAMRVSFPQSETFWSVHETPGDLARLGLGFAVCLWVTIHLFTLPKTVEAYKRWINLGLVIAPVALALAIIIWR